MSRAPHFDKIVEQVHKRVPEAKVETTDENLPRWMLANRAAWLEYDTDGKLLLSGTKGGGSTVTRKHKNDETASDAAAVIAELLLEPVKPVEEGAERPI